MVNEQPAIRSLNRNRAGSYLHALPCADLKRSRRHDMTMMAPILQVRRFGIKNISESRMSGVTRTGQHGELPTYLLREQNPVTVVRQKSVLNLMEYFEIGCPRDSDCRAMITVTPGHIILPVEQGNPGIVTIDPFGDLRIRTRELHILFIDFPVDSIDRKTGMQAHTAVGIITTENSRIVVLAFLERDNSGIEYGIGGG